MDNVFYTSINRKQHFLYLFRFTSAIGPVIDCYWIIFYFKLNTFFFLLKNKKLQFIQ